MTKTLAAIFSLKNQLTKVGALCLVSLTLLKPAFASDLYVFDRDHTNITWHAGHFGFSNQSGRFNQVEGSIILDRHSPNRSHVEVTINTASIVTGLGNFDNYLKGVNFLNVETFPTATFISDQIEIKGSQNALVHGKLTLLGVTKPVTLETRLNKIGINPFSKKQTAGFSASTTIKRSDFGMNFGTPDISDQIRINIEAEAIFSKTVSSKDNIHNAITTKKDEISQSNDWNIIPDTSKITFKAKQLDAEVRGAFNQLSGTIVFDPKHLPKSSIDVSVDTQSIELAFGDSQIVKAKEWLFTDQFPKATFTSKNIMSLDFNNEDFTASGMLTIKGVSVPASINFKLTKYLPSSGKVTATGSFIIKRSDFKIGDRNPARAQGVADDVVINFIINAKK